MTNFPILPSWITVPLGALGLLVMAGHLLSLPSLELPPLQKRVRIATTALMMLATPLLVYAASVSTPADPRAFALAWSLVAALLVMVVGLALADILLGWARHRAELADLRRAMRERQAAATPREDQARDARP